MTGWSGKKFTTAILNLGADGFCSNLFSQCAAFNDYDHNQYLTVLTRQHLNVKNAHHSTLRQQSGLRNLS